MWVGVRLRACCCSIATRIVSLCLLQACCCQHRNFLTDHHHQPPTTDHQTTNYHCHCVTHQQCPPAVVLPLYAVIIVHYYHSPRVTQALTLSPSLPPSLTHSPHALHIHHSLPPLFGTCMVCEYIGIMRDFLLDDDMSILVYLDKVRR